MAKAKTGGELSLLCDSEIIDLLAKEELIIKPLLDPDKQIQPTSIDLRLGTSFAIIKNAEFTHLNLLKVEKEARRESASYIDYYHIGYDREFVLHPNEFALASTFEYIKLPQNISGRLEGKSTWGRLGLLIHSTAGFVDPGFRGTLTFELKNVGKAPVPLYPGMRIAQICLFRSQYVMQPYAADRKLSYAKNFDLQTSLYFMMPEFDILRKLRAEQQ
jgi:dCTP deaminase